MNFLKGIIGGIVGGIVGAAAWLALEHFVAGRFPTEWTVVGVGIMAGFGTRNAANADRASFGRGVSAIVLTLLCVLGARLSYTEFMVARELAAASTPAIAPGDGEDNSGQSDVSSENANGSPDFDSAEMAPDEQILPPPPNSTPTKLRFAFDPADMLWFGLAGFIAYLLGKSARKKPDAAKETTKDTAASDRESKEDAVTGGS